MFIKKEFRQFVEFSIPKTGLFKSTGLHGFLKKNLRSKRFEDLNIPFYVITTDWNKARTAIFSEGDDLIDAVVASCSVPVVFTPQYINGKPYVDGGLLKNLPVSVIRRKSRYVIGVNVSTMIPPAEKDNIRTMMERTFNLMSNSNTIIDKSYCDILIEVKGMEKYKMFDLTNMSAISDLGYHYTALKKKKKDSWKIVNKCHRHYIREKKVKNKIEYLRKKIQ